MLLFSLTISAQDDSDTPYLAGAVPEVDGKVVFSADVETKNLSVDEAYNRAYNFLESLATGKEQTDKSRIAIANPEEHSIVGIFCEKLVFHKRALELDQTLFNYVIAVQCTEGNTHISIERLTYDYTVGKTVTHMTANEIITDKDMLSSDGTKLKKTYSKFRRTTVDRMRELLSKFEEAMK